MNCLDCRRKLLIDPSARDPDLTAHLRECGNCARFATDQSAFEQRLEAALRVPVPENLREQVLFAASMRRRRSWHWLAAAAVLVLAIGIGLGGWEQVTSQRLADDMVAHIHQDTLRDQPADAQADEQLTRLVNGLGARLDSAGLGKIARARKCDIDDHRGVHFVIHRGDRRGSVFMLPDARLAMEHHIRIGNMHGTLVPTDGGVIAVFCPDRQMLTKLVENIRGSVRWPA